MCADTSQCLLNATGVKVRYGTSPALDDIDLALSAGDTLGLLGLNGAGKSTLLRVLAGVQAPCEGTITIGGMDLHKDPVNARQALGYAPDKPPIYPEFTVKEFLHFAARIRRVAAKDITRSADEVIEKCGLGNVSKRIIGNLSHGYQQRVNLAQALVHQPGVLILDEPTNGLDPAQLLEMRELINDIHDQQATLFSSHLLNEVQATCNRAIVVNNGSKLLDMPIDQIDNDQHTTYEIVLQQAAKQADLQNLPGVVSVCPVDPQHWLLTTSSQNNLTSIGLGEALLARGMQLLEVTPVRNHLERMFSQLKLNAQHNSQQLGTAIGEAS